MFKSCNKVFSFFESWNLLETAMPMKNTNKNNNQTSRV